MYRTNGDNGSYVSVNGANGGRHLQRFDFEASSRDTSADERSRSRGPGGYGGFGGQQQQAASRVQGPSRLNRERAPRRSRDEGVWDSSRSRSRPGAGFGRANGQVEETLRYIEQQWSFMASSSCVPIKIALQLNDSSSLGLMDQYDQFQQTHEQLQASLKSIVNEHHQGFNSSIGTFHKIQAAIHASQHRVRTLKTGLVAAKGTLAGTRPELKAFAQNSQSYDHMLQVLATIEQLQVVPEKLEAQISEKRFLAAVDTLQEALKFIRKPEMEEIGALSDLRVYLSNQEHSLTDILVEELHSHLYLKSPYCEERWKSHALRETTSGTIDAQERAMYLFLESYNGSKPMQEDTARNPEADTFYYIQLLVESLNKMSRLDVAVDAIEQRLPVELFRVVERSHSEVAQRHPSMLLSAARQRQQKLGLGEGLDPEQKDTLEDLLNTLYAKFEAIAEGHRVLHDITGSILKREGQSDPALNRSFRELWKLLQSEIRSLLHDHLATDGNLGHRARQDNGASANIFKPHPRDKNKRLFKLSDTDSTSTELTTEREDLEYILKSSVPGLVNSTVRDAKKDHNEASAFHDRSATGHKLLVEPSVFNMGILLAPSLAFLNRLKDVVPPHSGVVPSTLTSFLDDFLINVFYPQLDETLIELCTRCMNDLDAFQPDPKWPEHSQKPIFKGTILLFDVILGVCSMLDSLPHDQTFSQLVITQLRVYYDRCFEWAKVLLQRLAPDGSAKMRLAADLATSGNVSQIIIKLLTNTSIPNSDPELAEQETEALITLAKSRTIEEADLIHDRKSLAALCTLHTSMKWLSARSQALKYISPRAIDSSNTSSHHNRRWTETQTTSLSSAPARPYLPLDVNTAREFDNVVTSFTELSSLILRTLHIDLRLHLLHGISTASRTTYALEQPYNDPDPAILALASSLASYDTQLTTHLLQSQYAFITTQLDVLAAGALVSLISMVSAMDEHGLARMQLNVLVLQQCLKNVQADASLEKAARFYEMGMQGPDEIVENGRKEGFRVEDLKYLIRLIWRAERDGYKGGGPAEWADRIQ